MNYPALVIAGLGIVALLQMLKTGSGSPDGENFRREEQPMVYWSLFGALVAVELGLLYFAFRNLI